jgi:hypothetical protein
MFDGLYVFLLSSLYTLQIQCASLGDVVLTVKVVQYHMRREGGYDELACPQHLPWGSVIISLRQNSSSKKELATTHPLFQKEEAQLDGDSVRDPVPLQSHLLPFWLSGAWGVWLVEVGSELGTGTSDAAAWVSSLCVTILAPSAVDEWATLMSQPRDWLASLTFVWFSSVCLGRYWEAACFRILSCSFFSSHPTMQCAM